MPVGENSWGIMKGVESGSRLSSRRSLWPSFKKIVNFWTELPRAGIIKYLSWWDQTMQIYVEFEGFHLNSALVWVGSIFDPWVGNIFECWGPGGTAVQWWDMWSKFTSPRVVMIVLTTWSEAIPGNSASLWPFWDGEWVSSRDLLKMVVLFSRGHMANVGQRLGGIVRWRIESPGVTIFTIPGSSNIAMAGKWGPRLAPGNSAGDLFGMVKWPPNRG